MSVLGRGGLKSSSTMNHASCFALLFKTRQQTNKKAFLRLLISLEAILPQGLHVLKWEGNFPSQIDSTFTENQDTF